MDKTFSPQRTRYTSLWSTVKSNAIPSLCGTRSRILLAGAAALIVAPVAAWIYGFHLAS